MFHIPRRKLLIGAGAAAICAPHVAEAFLPRGGSNAQQSQFSAMIAGMTAGNWLQLNSGPGLVSFFTASVDSSAWPANNGGRPYNNGTCSAFSGFAWDQNREDILCWGGGHAGYSGNEVYRWRSSTLNWERGMLPSQIVQTNLIWNGIDGFQHTPLSSHGYGTNVFCPILDRFVVFGGAAIGSGGLIDSYSLTDIACVGGGSTTITSAFGFNAGIVGKNIFLTGGGATTNSYLVTAFNNANSVTLASPPGTISAGEGFVATGPYFLNPALLDPRSTSAVAGQKVGGLANSDVLGTAPAGNMWVNHDQQSLWTTNSFGWTTNYALEGGKDVIYYPVNGIIRYVPDLNPANDTFSTVGSNSPSEHAASYNSSSGCYLTLAANDLYGYWDLKTAPGPSNSRLTFTPQDLTGPQGLPPILVGGFYRGLAVAYDTVHNRHTVTDGSLIWDIREPSPLSQSGWKVTVPPTPTGSVPDPTLSSSQAPYGLWKWIAKYGIFLLVTAGSNGTGVGQVWAYKPLEYAHG